MRRVCPSVARACEGARRGCIGVERVGRLQAARPSPNPPDAGERERGSDSSAGVSSPAALRSSEAGWDWKQRVGSRWEVGGGECGSDLLELAGSSHAAEVSRAAASSVGFIRARPSALDRGNVPAAHRLTPDIHLGQQEALRISSLAAQNRTSGSPLSPGVTRRCWSSAVTRTHVLMSSSSAWTDIGPGCIARDFGSKDLRAVCLMR